VVQESRKEWRPPNWDKVNPDPCTGCKRKEVDDYGFVCDLACGEHSAYLQREAGADAMLEALKATGIHTTQGYMGAYRYALGLTGKSTDKGQLFFIPDKEE